MDCLLGGGQDGPVETKGSGLGRYGEKKGVAATKVRDWESAGQEEKLRRCQETHEREARESEYLSCLSASCSLVLSQRFLRILSGLCTVYSTAAKPIPAPRSGRFAGFLHFE